MAKKSGFTMVELVVATAVSALLMLALVTVMVPVYRTYQRTLARADAGLVAGNVLDTLRAGANTASSVSATQGGVDVGRGTYSVTDGILYFYDASYGAQPSEDKKRAVFDPGYYNGKTISLESVQTGYRTVQVTVKVFGDGQELYTLSTVLSPLRNALEGESRYTPEGMYETARAVIAGGQNSGGGQTAANETLLQTVYGGAFPQYDRSLILTDAQLNGLIQNSVTGEEAAYYQALLDGSTDFYLATYVTDQSLPVVYLTDGPKGVSDEDPSAKLYLVSYNNVWYTPNPVYDSRKPAYFDHKSQAEIASALADQTAWRTVSQLTGG